MGPEERQMLVGRLAEAFGEAEDVSPGVDQSLHVRLSSVELPDPWTPSPTRAITVWANWPSERPSFAVDLAVRGEGGEPPRSHHDLYIAGEAWRGFSFTFAWTGSDPVRAVQMWLTRFTLERS